ncbi:MAG: T9SS type A sorting domain-containing protein [bacterium]|jgi:hypothetical protein
MKPALLFLITECAISIGYPQNNRVFSGGEALNFGIVDISLNDGTVWSSERAAYPGYFSSLENASYIGYSDEANIDGYIKKYGNTAFVFPVGNGKDLRILEISNPDKITDAYATAWIEGDPSITLDPTEPYAGKHSVLAVAGSIAAVSTAGQWDWQVGHAGNLGAGTTGNGDGLQITLSMPDMSQFADKANLRLVGWNGSTWIDLSGKATATGNKENSMISGTMIPGISAVAIGKIAPTSLVKIISFSATSSNCNTLLTWETSIENKSSIFILEQSMDAVNFRTISSLAIDGLSGGNRYTKEVVQPIGIAHYRLKIQHANGTHEYSSIVSFNNKCRAIENMLVYPNPVVNNKNINLRFTTFYEGAAEITIVSSTGQRVFKKSVMLKPKDNMLTIEVNHLIHGAYFINIQSSSGEQIGNTTQFIKQ